MKGFTGATRETRVTGGSKEGEGGGGEEKGKDVTIQRDEQGNIGLLSHLTNDYGRVG